jgi:putative ABC transport system substrate-binding protein
VKRREFITLLGGAAAAWPVAARAQQPERMPRIGALMAFTENDPEEKLRVNALRQGLRELGWEEGRNVQTIWRFAAVDPNLMRSYAIELVNLKPNVVVAENTSVVAAVLRETRAIPIVFVVVGDPIGSGFVASFARPGAMLLASPILSLR